MYFKAVPRYTAVLVALLTAVSALQAATQEAGENDGRAVQNLFSDGDGGYPRFRIPALAALENGTLLAFAEARTPEFPGQHDDHAQNDIVLRRSLDGGDTWQPLQVVATMGRDSLNDPCVIVIPESGRILLMFQRFPEGFHARRMEHTEVAEPGYDGPRNTQSFLTFSDDQGATWSTPRDITRSVRSADTISVGSPGAGIVLKHGRHTGRILFPLYEVIWLGDGEERYWRNRAAISDDGGETWRLSQRVPIDGFSGFGNECQLAELADGTIRLNARIQSGAHRLARAVSHDGGETWTSLEADPQLITTPCMAGLISYAPAQSTEVWLLASLPNSDVRRERGALFVSRDGGKSWPLRQSIYPGGFAYSALAALPDGRVACLFERGPYEHISLVLLNIDSTP